MVLLIHTSKEENMKQERERLQEFEDFYRLLEQESEEFGEYLVILEALPQEPLYPSFSIVSAGNTTVPSQ
jgi:hypothetical protein